MASSNDKDFFISSSPSNVALIPMKYVSAKASAKKSVSSIPDGPNFIRKSFFVRFRNKFQPYLSNILDFFDRFKKERLAALSEEVYDLKMDIVMTTLIEHYMNVNDLKGSCEDVKKFWREAPLGDHEEIAGLLTEMEIIRKTDQACAMFNDKAVDSESPLDIKDAFALMCELLNGFSLDPDV